MGVQKLFFQYTGWDTSRTGELVSRVRLRAVWLRGWERGQSPSSLSFSCTPCRGAFGGKSTAKPPTRQRSHQTKNSYHSRTTRHFRSSNKFGFCRLLVLFDCSLLAIVGMLTFLQRLNIPNFTFSYQCARLHKCSFS